jgi:hypothetical protein
MPFFLGPSECVRIIISMKLFPQIFCFAIRTTDGTVLIQAGIQILEKLNSTSQKNETGKPARMAADGVRIYILMITRV